MSDMKNPEINENNQFVEFLEQGKDVLTAVKPKEIIDVRQKLQSKYPGTPFPNPNRIIRTVSLKQQRGIRKD